MQRRFQRQSSLIENRIQADPNARARCSLEGLSVGDAFGEQFFLPEDMVRDQVARRALPEPPWAFTDDSQMALSIVAVLRRCGHLDQDRLAESFARHYQPRRDYGLGMHNLLQRLRAGASWREVSPTLFGWQGSYGNGSAMRVAPLGAYFADDLGQAAAQAARSAEVTHCHPEGIAGAVAVAIAAALAWQFRSSGSRPAPELFLDRVLEFVPASEVRSRILQARDFAPDTPVSTVAARLGSGDLVSAQDTVPFALWCSATRLHDYELALWDTVSGLGDRDTTCAMVGGVVVMFTGEAAIPPAWLRAREPLPKWPLHPRIFDSLSA